MIEVAIYVVICLGYAAIAVLHASDEQGARETGSGIAMTAFERPATPNEPGSKPGPESDD